MTDLTSTRLIPLLYDEGLDCASFDLYLGEGVPLTTHDLDVVPLFERLPGLRKHRCDSGKQRCFFDEARQTESAHLLEHLCIELLVQSGIPRSHLRGETGIPSQARQQYSRNTQNEGQICNNQGPYRLRIYGVESLPQAEKALSQAVHILEVLAKTGYVGDV